MHRCYEQPSFKWPNVRTFWVNSLQCNTPDIKSGRFPWLPFPGSFCLHCKPNTTHFSLQTPNLPPLASMTNWPNTRCLQGRGGCQENPMKRWWMYSAQRKVRVEQNLNTAGRCWAPKEGVYEDVKWMWEVFGWKPGSRHLGLGTLFIFIQKRHMFHFKGNFR